MKKYVIIRLEDKHNIHINNKFIRIFNENNKLMYKQDISELLSICLDIPTMIYNIIMNKNNSINHNIPILNCDLGDGNRFLIYRLNYNEYVIDIVNIKDRDDYVSFRFNRLSVF